MNRVRALTRKPLGMIGLLVLAGLAAAGCGAGSEPLADNLPPASPGEPRHGGSITVALEAETNSYLPGRGAIGAPGTNVALTIFDALVRRDHNGNWRPYLAESIEPNADYTVWTLRLRPDVRFHDGTPLDAAALKWNFDNLHKVPGSLTWGSIRDIERMEVVGELTVEYHLHQGIVAFPHLLINAAGWPFSPTAARRHGEDAGSHPVGTGPFAFVSWRRDDRLVVRRNDDYWWDALPYLDQIVFRPIPDEDSRLASLNARSVDAMQSLRQSIIAQVRSTPNLHRYEFYGNNGGGANINTGRPPLDDARIRRSLAWALYQDALIEVLGGVDITPAKTQHYTIGSRWHSERVAAAWPRNDQDKARELLRAYMEDPDRSDGRPPGAPVSVEFRCPPDPSLIELAQMYQALWRAVGFEVRLRQMEAAAGVQATLAGDYQISCARAGDELDPYITLSNLFGPPDEQPLNLTNFHHPIIAENLEVLRTERDFEHRYEAVERIMMLFTRKVPFLWTAATPTVIAVRPDLRNIAGWRFPDGTPGDGTPNALAMWGQVWLAAEE
jgi:peptide/nickel transport system substrate-binding protein